jgi:hypothetical protein
VDGGKRAYKPPTIRKLTRDELTSDQRAWADTVRAGAPDVMAAGVPGQSRADDTRRNPLGAGAADAGAPLCGVATPADAMIIKRHALCDRCWSDFAPGSEPVRVLGVVENCCRCGYKTKAGIFVRVEREATNEEFATAWPNCRCRP